MNVSIATFAAAALAVAASALQASSADTKTWYVYCEGNEHGENWAVFSENFWPHPLTEGYGRQVGNAAKAFFEARHNMRLEGCAGVNFVDSSLARHSRSRTAQLHKKMGDRVFFFPLPNDALPAELAGPEKVAVEMTAAPEPSEKATAPAAGAASATNPAFKPQRAER